MKDTLSKFYFRYCPTILPISDLEVTIFSDHYDFICFFHLKLNVIIILRNLLEFKYTMHSMDWICLPFILFGLIICNRAFLCAHHNPFPNPTDRCSFANNSAIFKYDIEPIISEHCHFFSTYHYLICCLWPSCYIHFRNGRYISWHMVDIELFSIAIVAI